eukprot:scaffold597_cov176-Amphora_coffeaeformis.AAC.23
MPPQSSSFVRVTSLALLLSWMAVTISAFRLTPPNAIYHHHHHERKRGTSLSSPPPTCAAVDTATTILSSTAVALSSTAEASRSLIDIDEKAQRDIGTMDEWATASGVQRAEGFQLTATSTDEEPLDVGVMTTADLAAGSPVLFVPHQMILSAQQAKQQLGTVPQAETMFTNLGVSSADSDRFYLFLKILVEYEQGQLSPWYPWLNALPRYYSNGASMTHFCCSNCLPPLVGNLAMEERRRFRQFFKALDFVEFLTLETKGHKTLAKW